MNANHRDGEPFIVCHLSWQGQCLVHEVIEGWLQSAASRIKQLVDVGHDPAGQLGFSLQRCQSAGLGHSGVSHVLPSQGGESLGRVGANPKRF